MRNFHNLWVCTCLLDDNLTPMWALCLLGSRLESWRFAANNIVPACREHQMPHWPQWLCELLRLELIVRVESHCKRPQIVAIFLQLPLTFWQVGAGAYGCLKCLPLALRKAIVVAGHNNCLANSRGLARQIGIDTEALNPTHRKRIIDGHFQLWTQFISLQTRDWHPNFQNLQEASLQGTILSVKPKFGSQDPKHHRICIEASLKWALEDQMPQCMWHMQKQALQTLDSILTWGGLK